MENNKKNNKDVPKSSTTEGLLGKFEDRQSSLDPTVRSNAFNIPGGIYQNNKIGYPYGQDTAPEGGPLKDRFNRPVKTQLNQFTENNTYKDYVKNLKQLPFKSNKKQPINLKLPKPNINLDTFLGSGTNFI